MLSKSVNKKYYWFNNLAVILVITCFFNCSVAIMLVLLRLYSLYATSCGPQRPEQAVCIFKTEERIGVIHT
jgi:hypothetical protein